MGSEDSGCAKLLLRGDVFERGDEDNPPEPLLPPVAAADAKSSRGGGRAGPPSAAAAPPRGEETERGDVGPSATFGSSGKRGEEISTLFRGEMGGGISATERGEMGGGGAISIGRGDARPLRGTSGSGGRSPPRLICWRGGGGGNDTASSSSSSALPSFVTEPRGENLGGSGFLGAGRGGTYVASTAVALLDVETSTNSTSSVMSGCSCVVSSVTCSSVHFWRLP